MGPRGHLHTLIHLLERGLLKPTLADSLPLTDLAEAHRKLEAREVFGKIAIRP